MSTESYICWVRMNNLTWKYEGLNEFCLRQGILKKAFMKLMLLSTGFEAKYYELLHPEVYSKQEQKRIIFNIKNSGQTCIG